MTTIQHFVVDGHERAWAALEPDIRAEVDAEYAERWHEASPLERLRLWFEIRREIRRRIDRHAPPDALY